MAFIVFIIASGRAWVLLQVDIFAQGHIPRPRFCSLIDDIIGLMGIVSSQTILVTDLAHGSGHYRRSRVGLA